MQNTNAAATAPIVPSAQPPTANQPSGGYSTYPSEHSVTRNRYITSNDPRGYLPVYEYTLNNQFVMMDIDDGYVLWTSICKALNKTKAEIAKMVENDPEIPPRIRKVKGGFLKVQGTWIPYERALTLARKIAWPIRNDLIPLFGPEFPDTCLKPSDPGYGEVSDNRRRGRRHTQPASISSPTATGSQSGTSTASTSPGQSQPWISSSPPVHQRRATTSTFPEQSPVSRATGGYPVVLPASPRGPGVHPGSPNPQGPYQPYLGGHQQAGQRYAPPSSTPSPTHTVKEEPYAADSPYIGEAPYHYPHSESYHPYGSGYAPPTSPPVYPASTNSYQLPSHNSGYGTHHQYGQEFSQPTTPTRTVYSDYENYAPHGVNLDQGQPCDTYHHGYNQQATYNTHGDEYGSHYSPQNPTYPQYSQPTRAPHHASSYSYGPAESNVRFEPSYPSESVGSSSRAPAGEYGYNYSGTSTGGQELHDQRTYQQSPSGHYGNSEYHGDTKPPQQPYGGGYSYQPPYSSESYNNA